MLAFTLFFINTMVISNTTINHNLTHELLSEKPKNKIKTQLDEFLDNIGNFESGNDYTRVNRLGYMGRFQFGLSTIKTLGYRKLTREQFINNPSLQDTMMIKNLRYNKRRLKRYIKNWNGKTRFGIKITESGMLAAAHLAGQGNVKKFLRNGYNPSDINGTNLSKYLSIFSGYDLNLK
jgi:hypothetical protein